MDRKKILREYIRLEPENPFNYYALALESKEHDPEYTSQLFDFLIENYPKYLPVYFPSAHFFADLGKLEKARCIFQKGIELARNQFEYKTLKELQNAYQNFLFEHDLE